MYLFPQSALGCGCCSRDHEGQDPGGLRVSVCVEWTWARFTVGDLPSWNAATQCRWMYPSTTCTASPKWFLSSTPLPNLNLTPPSPIPSVCWLSQDERLRGGKVDYWSRAGPLRHSTQMPWSLLLWTMVPLSALLLCYEA